MAKNQNDYEIQGRELFLSGQACPNGSSWQQAAMRRGWEVMEVKQVLRNESIFRMALNAPIRDEQDPIITRARSTKNAVESHIKALKALALAEPISSIRYYRLADKVNKLKAKYSLLLSSN